jgi:hypothetical protein
LSLIFNAEAQPDDKLRATVELRKLANGWAVWDTKANAPAIVEGRWQTDMEMDGADDTTDLLNRLGDQSDASKT